MSAADPHLELTPLAALGALDGADWDRFQAHAAGCRGCRAEVAANEAVAAWLARALPRVDPSPVLRARILARTDPALAAPRRLAAAVPVLAAAAAVVLGIALLAVRGQRDDALRLGAAARQEARVLQDELQRARRELAEVRSRAVGTGDDRAETVATLEAELGRTRAELLSLRQRLEADTLRARQTADAMATEVQRARDDLASARARIAEARALNDLVAHPEARVTALQGLEAAPGARGRVVWNPTTREAVLIASGLDAAPAGKTYEVWVIAQAAPVPAGVFQVDATGRAVFRLPVVEDTARVKTFAVTLEPAAGTPAPTGPMVLAGSVS